MAARAIAGDTADPGTTASDRLARPAGENMNSLKTLVRKLLSYEQGGEVLEYALIAGLIVVAAVAVIGTVGTRVLARWTSIDAGL